VELWWSGCGLVVARARALAVDSWWQGQGRFAAAALPQQLCGSAAAAASLAEAATALLQHGVSCGGGSGQLGGGIIINKTRNSIWVEDIHYINQIQ
jgi:hypothetical protein